MIPEEVMRLNSEVPVKIMECLDGQDMTTKQLVVATGYRRRSLYTWTRNLIVMDLIVKVAKPAMGMHEMYYRRKL